MKKIIMLALFVPIYMCGYAQPANDDACGAVNLPVGNTGCEPTIAYNYTAATWSSGSGNQYCINPGNNLDVWYKFTVPANGEAIVAIANGDANGYMAEVYSSTSCNALTILNQTTNGFPCLFTNTGSSSPGAQTYKALTPGSTIYVRAFRYYGNTAGFANGNIKICVSNTDGFADDPCTAGYFPVGAADPLGQTCIPTQAFTWAGATLTPAVPNPSCLQNMPATDIRDVWFKVKVPSTGKLQINTSSNYNFYTNNSDWNFVVAYTNSNGCSGTFTEIGCVMSWTGTALTWTTLTPGSDIYVRLIKYNSATYAGNGNAKICAEILNSLPGIDNTKKIGIGIDTPFAKLDVVGTGIFRDKLTAASDVEVRGNLIVKGNIVGKYGTAVLQGNTTIQGGPLTIDSLDLGSRLGNRIALYGGLGNSPKYGFGIQGGTLQMFSDLAASNITFGYGNSYNLTERARIINQGEYGMTLKGRLQLNSGTQSAGLWLTNAANTVNTSFIGMQSDNLVGLYGASGAGWGLAMNTATGNVGIGLNGVNPTVPLQFSNALGLTKISLYKGTYGDVGIGAYGGELRLQNDIPNGKVSFGVLETTGTFTELAKAERNGAFAFSIFGNLWANGTTYPSDGRFKKNIQPLQQSLEKILQLQGVSYEMKTDEFPNQHFDKGSQVGLIAQDVEKLVPQVVTEGPNGYKAIDYAKLVPLLIESIKELNKKIEILEARLKF